MHTPELLCEGLTRSIIGAFYEVYNQLGYGFLEQVYANALERELVARNHRVLREYRLHVWYNATASEPAAPTW